MFTIELSIKETTLRGFAALNTLRQLGLPDDTLLVTDSSSFPVVITENEALSLSPLFDTVESVPVIVPLSSFEPGELTISHEKLVHSVVIRGAISKSRVIQFTRDYYHSNFKGE